MNGSEKSSRSKADYFEVLIADKLAKHYKVQKSFQREITELEKEITLIFADGKYIYFRTICQCYSKIFSGLSLT